MFKINTLRIINSEYRQVFILAHHLPPVVTVTAVNIQP